MNFSPKNPVSMISTFSAVLIFTSVKELYEDLKRCYCDREVNEKDTKIYNPDSNSYELKKWKNILPGDIIKINKNDSVPADILLLKSSNPSAICFIDTINLDGENNLKEKLCINFKKKLKVIDYSVFNGYLTCDYPNEILEKWDCSLFIKARPILCSIKNLLLKGSILKNTEFIEGIVIYTGHNTKIMKNAKKPPMKISNVLHLMNKLLISLFIFQLLICISFSILYIFWIESNYEKINYLLKYERGFHLEEKEGNLSNFVVSFFTFLVAYSHLIPISLYVTLEIVKIIQSVLIRNDIKMIDPVSNKNAFAKTSDLIEELGQIQFVFSDKTGTLTKNEMVFKKCSISNQVYSDLDKVVLKPSNSDKGPIQQILNKSVESIEKKLIWDFFTICCLCHSAYIDDSEGKRVYQVL
jgi:phospholipid-transporting ATPase